MSFQVREVAESLGEDPGDSRPLIKVIEDLRDEVGVLTVKGHGFGSRNLAMVLGHLDEARLWATEYAVKERHSHLLIDKAHYRDMLDRTDSTDTPEGEPHV
jgi:hypothetical protein